MTLRKIVEIDEELCDGCGQCVLSCAEGAIEIIEGKAKLVKDSYCDGLGACLGECPQGALQVIEREAEEFDPEAVECYLQEKVRRDKGLESSLPCGCPSSHIQTFASPCQETDYSAARTNRASALTHWPVQIRLVPAKAPFLRGAHLLVAADCTPVAYADFHQDFMSGKVVLLGCPKFDNVAEYVEKFEDIFRVANIQSVTVLDMEVPCCSALPALIKKGMQAAGKTIPLEEVTVGVRGEILQRKRSAA